MFTSEQRAYAFDQLRVLLSEFMEKTDCVSEVLYDGVIQYHELPQLVFEDHTVGTRIEVGVDDQIGYNLCILTHEGQLVLDVKHLTLKAVLGYFQIFMGLEFKPEIDPNMSMTEFNAGGLD